MASHFGRMTPVIKGQAPYDAAQIKANVEVLKTLSALPWTAFGAGTEGGDARPEIWSDAAGFKQKQQAFQDNIVKLRPPPMPATWTSCAPPSATWARAARLATTRTARRSKPSRASRPCRCNAPRPRASGCFSLRAAREKPPGSSGRLALRFVCRRGV